MPLWAPAAFSTTKDQIDYALFPNSPVDDAHVGNVLSQDDNTQNLKRDWNTMFRCNSSVSVRVRRGVASANHRAYSEFSPGLAPL
jgi:hypothetical protein